MSDTSAPGTPAESPPGVTEPNYGPTGFRYWEGRYSPRALRAERVVRRLTGHDLFPPDEVVRDYCADLFTGDPVAERFVDDVFHGEIGRTRGRALLLAALAGGIDSVPDAPESMRALFAEFEQVPGWVDLQLVEAGAAIWRRWGTMLFSVAGTTTLEIYTEAPVALPLSLTGGYAGDNALRRFLETSRFWLDVAEPGALARPGSQARATAMLVRVMHVSVRRQVMQHPEWDAARWGLPISQGYMMLTLIGGSVAPALALWLLGYQTTGREMRELLHFQRFLGHLLGVRARRYPRGIRDCLQLLAMSIAARSYDSGEAGSELIESFPRSFAPRPGQSGLRRARAAWSYRMHSAYAGVWLSPYTRATYDLPPAFPWVLVLLARFPLITAAELARHLIPGVDRAYERVGRAHAENWWRLQMDGRTAEFEAAGGLRR